MNHEEHTQKRGLTRLTSMPVLPPVPMCQSLLKSAFQKQKMLLFWLKIALYFIHFYSKFPSQTLQHKSFPFQRCALRTISNFSIVTGSPGHLRILISTLYNNFQYRQFQIFLAFLSRFSTHILAAILCPLYINFCPLGVLFGIFVFLGHLPCFVFKLYFNCYFSSFRCFWRLVFVSTRHHFFVLSILTIFISILLLRVVLSPLIFNFHSP